MSDKQPIVNNSNSQQSEKKDEQVLIKESGDATKSTDNLINRIKKGGK